MNLPRQTVKMKTTEMIVTKKKSLLFHRHLRMKTLVRMEGMSMT
ncbi:hypothetical protein QZH41_009066 [Actinostola sp. cb2023]|nr:hypothetical protein QZH41_009066 [Actinostola sp. cb2023]